MKEFIAMKCNKEQFNEIKPTLIKNGLVPNAVS